MNDGYFNQIENNYDESEISEKEFTNDSRYDEPMLCLDIVAMIPMPPIRRQGRRDIRRSVSGHFKGNIVLILVTIDNFSVSIPTSIY